MTDDTASGRHVGRPARSSPGRLDPAPDPLPDPGQRPVPAPAEPATAPGPTRPSTATPTIRRSRTGGLWVGLVLSALVLLLLLVFIPAEQPARADLLLRPRGRTPPRGGPVAGSDRRDPARGDPGQPADSAATSGRPPRIEREGMTVLRLGDRSDPRPGGARARA